MSCTRHVHKIPFLYHVNLTGIDKGKDIFPESKKFKLHNLRKESYGWRETIINHSVYHMPEKKEINFLVREAPNKPKWKLPPVFFWWVGSNFTHNSNMELLENIWCLGTRLRYPTPGDRFFHQNWISSVYHARVVVITEKLQYTVIIYFINMIIWTVFLQEEINMS